MLEFENKEVVNEFLEETLSGFDTIENTMLQLELEPSNLDLINIIFRPIHSLKGNSAYFGLMRVKKVTHNLENLLDSARKEKLIITSDIINVLLSSIDYLKEMIVRVENNEDEVIDEDKYLEKIKVIDEILAEQDKPFALKLNDKNKIIELLNQIKTDAKNIDLDIIEDALSIFVQKEKLKETKFSDEVLELESLFVTPFPEGDATDTEIELMNQLIIKLKSQCVEPDAVKSYDKFKDAFDTFALSGIGLDEIAQEILNESLTELRNHLSVVQNEEKENLNKEKDTLNEKNNEKKIIVSDKKQQKVKNESTIRIKEKSLDDFLNYVGDLLSVEELFVYFGSELSKYDLNLSSNYKQNVENFSRISEKLRTSIMDIRRIESSTLLQKVPRLVRDIAKNSEKEIDVTIVGEKLKIDKSYIELLDSPIVHMVRNAADHGIESKEERIKAGKSEKGHIEVSILENDKTLILEVKDNGKGLDFEALKLKAIEKGIIKSNKELNENDIINLLFKSGISTAKKVTDVSGRGVGMDVVKTAITEANGKISVKSEKGSGSIFSIELPKNVSTKINEVYLVKSFSNEIYALPLKLIEEAFTLDKDEVYSINNQGNILKRREKLLTVLVLDEILGVDENCLNKYFHKDSNIPFVFINLPKKPLALCVKDVVGVQTIVVKTIDGLEIDDKIFEGGATLGDGKIALQIRPEWLQEYL